MKINRQLAFILLGSVLLFACLSAAVSYQVLSKMQETSAHGFLVTTSNFARSISQDQAQRFQAVGSTIMAAHDTTDPAEAAECLGIVAEQLPKASFAIIIDADGTQIASSKSILPRSGKVFQPYLDELRRTGEMSIASMDTINLDELYAPEASERSHHLVRTSDGNEITKSLANLVIVSANDRESFLVLGELVNNNPRYSELYSAQVEDSFLSYAVDGIRVSTNLSPSKDGSAQLGTTTPVVQNDIPAEGVLGQEFSPAGYQYYYFYTPVKNHWGELVASMAVGIRESAYSGLIHSNTKVILVVTAIIAPLVIAIAWIFSNRITRSVRTGMSLVQDITQGNFDAIESHPKTESPGNEIDRLIDALRTMALTLRTNQATIQSYTKSLRESEADARSLADQLRQTNENLEAMVESRTFELQQLAKSLQISNSTKTRFIANISHELKTPLTNCITAADLLLSEMFGSLTEKQRTYVTNIQQSGQHLLQLINDILSMAKIDEGNIVFRSDATRVDDVMNDVVGILSSSYPLRTHDITSSVAPENLQAITDATTLRQVLYNLLSNALKFSEQSSPVEATAFESVIDNVPVIKFEIRDRGIGIAPEDMERVFYEFEQVENSYSRTYEGTGLGLPLARRQTELLGGKLWLDSSLGQGTTAHFFIPKVPPPAQQT